MFYLLMNMGKYENLGRHLKNFSDNQVEYSFDNIQNILGFPLPKSASIYRPWWANDKTHVQARDGWMRFGWSVDSIDFSTKIVKFVKTQKLSGKTIVESDKKDFDKVTPSRFEEIARSVMSKHFFQELFPQKIESIPKLFDLVSLDRTIVGDAKYLSMVRGASIPPAKFSTIAEYIWLLEKTNAEKKFLVFGNDKRVPKEWLKRYGNLVSDVEFYFIDSNQKIERLDDR